MDPLTVEPLDRALAERVGSRIVRFGADTGWDDWTTEQLLSERPGKWELSLLARRGTEPVGYAVASSREGGVHLHHLVVRAEDRSKGTGAALLHALIDRARAAGADRLTLKVLASNEGARRFYEREGFSLTQGDASSGYVVMALEPLGR